MKRLAIAIRHVHFEDLGSFERVLVERDFEIRYAEAGLEDLSGIDPLMPDVLVVLGGPIGVYEDTGYPFLHDEIALLKERLRKDLPTLGICLGAQLIARALGARVYPGPQKEIGWQPLTLTPAGVNSCLRHLAGDRTNMLHWHGDTFDLPAGAQLLASTDECANQAFSYGRHTLAFQCHPEAEAAALERWFIGHACEISATPGVDVPSLRRNTARYGSTLERQGRACLSQWIESVELK